MATVKTQKYFNRLVDYFDNEHNGNIDYFGKVTIAGMVILSDYYLRHHTLGDTIDTTLLKNFKHHFSELEPCEYYLIARAIIDFYLGSRENTTQYNRLLERFKSTYKEYKDFTTKVEE